MRMIAELLVINGKGLKARTLGDPAVQGPRFVSSCSSESIEPATLTGLVSAVLFLGLCVVCSIGSELRR